MRHRDGTEALPRPREMHLFLQGSPPFTASEAQQGGVATGTQASLPGHVQPAPWSGRTLSSQAFFPTTQTHPTGVCLFFPTKLVPKYCKVHLLTPIFSLWILQLKKNKT